MTLTITMLLACGLSAWLVLLSAAVIQQRRAPKAEPGSDGEKWLERRIRAQANLTEYAPLFVILIGLAEFTAGPTIGLIVLAAMFMIGRLAHGYGMAFTLHSPANRMAGTALTFVSYGFAITYNLVLLAGGSAG